MPKLVILHEGFAKTEFAKLLNKSAHIDQNPTKGAKMKIEQKKTFEPIVITIENKE